MKTAYKILLAGSVLGGAAATVAAVRASAKAAKLRDIAGSIDLGQVKRLRDDAGHAIQSSLAAFGDGGAGTGSPADDLQRLEATLAELASRLSPEFATTLRSLTEAIAAAQAHVMAFDLNRANHGDPDSSQVKARNRARETFQHEVEPLLATIESALS